MACVSLVSEYIIRYEGKYTHILFLDEISHFYLICLYPFIWLGSMPLNNINKQQLQHGNSYICGTGLISWKDIVLGEGKYAFQIKKKTYIW